MAITPSNASHPKSILVLTFKLPDGNGDVAIGYEIYKLIKSALSGIEVIFSYINPPPDLMAMAFVSKGRWIQLTEEEHKYYEITNIQIVFQRIQKKQFNWIVINSIDEDQYLPALILNSGIPILKLQEYGAISAAQRNTAEGPIFPLGLGPNEAGVLFPLHLYEMRYHYPTYFQLIQQHTGIVGNNNALTHLIMEYAGIFPAQARLMHLRGLPTWAVDGILPNSKDKTLAFHQRVTEFQRTSRLYTSYVHNQEMMRRFIFVICSHKPDINPTICFLKPKPDPSFLNEDLRKKLVTLGFVRVVFQYGPNEQQIIALPGKKGTRILTILFSSLSPADADALILASEPETMMTGDSSFFKALAIGMWAGHENEWHKHGLINSFIDLVEWQNSELASLLVNCYYGSQEAREADSPECDYEDITKGLFNFFQLISRRKDLQMAWNKIIHDIATKHHFKDFYPKFLPRDIIETQQVLLQQRQKTSS